MPFDTVRICETALFPVIAGAAVFAGGRYCARTAPVDADHRVSEPEALEAFTEATMDLPTSLAEKTYVAPVWPSTRAHEAGFAVALTAVVVHRYQALVNVVGDFPHVPRLAASVFGTRAAPVIAG